MCYKAGHEVYLRFLTLRKKQEPKQLLRGTIFVRRTDPFLALFWLLFFLSGAVFLGNNVPSLQRGAIFQNGSSEAPVWLHFFF